MLDKAVQQSLPGGGDEPSDPSTNWWRWSATNANSKVDADRNAVAIIPMPGRKANLACLFHRLRGMAAAAPLAGQGPAGVQKPR